MVIFLTSGLWYQDGPPGYPHAMTLPAFYGTLAVGTVKVLLVTVFAALAGALLFADSSALFEAVRRSGPETPGLVLTVFIVILLMALSGWRASGHDLSALFRVTDVMLRTAVFAVLLLLFHAVADPDTRQALQDTVRAAAQTGGFTFRCIVMAGVYFALADTMRVMHRWTGAPASEEGTENPASA
jgi:hypothetical protein